MKYIKVADCRRFLKDISESKITFTKAVQNLNDVIASNIEPLYRCGEVVIHNRKDMTNSINLEQSKKYDELAKDVFEYFKAKQGKPVYVEIKEQGFKAKFKDMDVELKMK